MTWSARRQDGHGQMVRSSVRASKVRMAGLDSLGFIAKILGPWETKSTTSRAEFRCMGDRRLGELLRRDGGDGVDSVDDVQSMDAVAPVPIVQQ
jgi:hypothetical protein